DRRALLASALAGRVGPDVVRTVLAEARSIGSEGDRAQILSAAAHRSAGDQALLREVVDAARGISSPAELTYVLLAVAASGDLEYATQRELAEAVGGIASDEYRAHVLGDFVRRFGTGNAAVRGAFFRSLEGIGSSTARASVLLALADHGPLEGAVREDFLRAARGIGSGTERARVLARAQPRAAADTLVKAGAATTTLHWTDTGAGRRATLEARDTEVDERGSLRILPGGFVVIDESHGAFRQRVRVERGPDGRLRRSYTGDSVEPARRLEWEAALAARFAGGKRRRW
ncbi:MAG TPA: hypothetical protein VGV85_11465, partial [Longimicrobiaceae bacterium]|nr:hypothetical protein [Longimicrobiaceae bacterium]